MKIDYPVPSQAMELVKIWQDAFGDSLEFIEGFFCTGYSPSRCRCLSIGGQAAAVVYWLDVTCEGQRFAYLYAVATAAEHRNKGLCRTLMEDTRAHLAYRGYDGILLVPQTQALREMYSRMGYAPCTCIREFTCEAGTEAAALQRIDRDEYALLRRQLLPRGGALQEEENIAYLEMMAFFYRGEGVLLAARKEGNHLFCPELLGDASAAPGILAALRCAKGTFRTPGGETPFAMFLPLVQDAKAPTYLGFAFES